MEKIHDHVNDLYVRSRKAYANADGFAYADSAFTTKIGVDELHDAFVKGMLIIIDSNGVEYAPVSCKVESGTATVTYVAAGGNATVKSGTNE